MSAGRTGQRIVAMMLGALTAGCLLSTDSGGEQPEVSVSLINEADLPVHLMRTDEDFGTDNRVTPGAARTVFVKGAGDGDVVTFKAGRDGQVLATAQCTMVRERDGEDRGLREVIYSEPLGFSSFACRNWAQ